MWPKPRPALGLLLLPAFFLTAGCGLKERLVALYRGEEQDVALLRVGETLYYENDLNRFFESRLSEFHDASNGDKIKSNLLDSFIEDRLLLRQAEQLEIQPDAQLLQAMLEKIAESGADRQGARGDAELERSMAESLKMQQYLRDYVLKDVTVAEQECETYYKEHLDDYVQNDVVHLREILVGEKEQAERILALLKAKRNKNFGDLARDYSKGSTASEGGDLGLFQRGDLPEEFEKVVFRLPPGSASRIVTSKYGYHIFLAEEKIPAHQQKFYEVREAIREKLQLERERDMVDRELESLMRRIPVEINRDRLGFNYVGTRFSR